MFPLLFLATMDWVTRGTNKLGNKGVILDLTTRPENLDFADDIALLAPLYGDFHGKTENFHRIVKTVLLKKTVLLNIIKEKSLE